MNLGTKLSQRILQAETERIRTIPIHQQKIIQTVSIDIQETSAGTYMIPERHASLPGYIHKVSVAFIAIQIVRPEIV